MKKLTGPILLVGSTVECPDIWYASGFRAPDPVVLLVAGRKKYLIVSDLEFGRAQKESIGTVVYKPSMLGQSPKVRLPMSGWATTLIKKLGFKRISIPPTFPVAFAEKIRAAGIKTDICEGEVFPERAVKRPDEISKIKQSQHAAVIALRNSVAVISKARIAANRYLQYEGKRLTSEYVRKIIYRTLIDHECMEADVIVAGGTQSADPHMKGYGPLRAHEPIVMDIFPRHMEHGYWGDLTRTVCRGEAPARLKKMYTAVRQAQSKALSTVRPGVQCATVHKAAADEIARRGFTTGKTDGVSEGFIHGTGHGVGMAIHEAPSVAPNKRRLRSGNVITIEPGVYYHDIGGVRIEDTVIVTKTGWKYLAPCEKKLEV